MRLSGLLLQLALSAPPVDETYRRVTDLMAQVPGKVAAPTVVQKTTVNKIPVLQQSVTSNAKVQDLKVFFTDVFKRSGLYMAKEAQATKPNVGEIVTGLDTENLVSYTAWFQPAGLYTTVVIAGAEVANPGPVDESANPIAPVFPGAWALTAFRMEAMSSMTYSCHGTPAEIKKFYREELMKQGWTPGDEDMVFVKANVRAWLTIAPGIAERQVAMYMQTMLNPAEMKTKIPSLLPQKLYPEQIVPEPTKPPEPTPAPAPSKPAPTPKK